MKYFLCVFILLLNCNLSVASEEDKNPARAAALAKIAEYVHPDMAEMWKTFFANFDYDSISEWHFSENTGAFSMTLKNPLKFWVPASRPSSDPRPGSILLFGANNRVEGRLNWQKKSIEFHRGFQVYCRYKIGFISLPITVDVYSLTYKNKDFIILEAGKNGLSERKGKPLEKYLKAWNNPTQVVTGDYRAFLDSQSE